MSPTPGLVRITPLGAPPVTARPSPDRVVSGDPVFTSWDIEDRDGIYAGIWQSTPGAWRVIYDEWEYCHILSGHSVLTAEDGTAQDLRAGDSIVIRPGFRGVWEVLETTRKDYVIRV
ncbi:MAG: cupin domain-containing protein [Rhodobacteraceae bacterium]|jgi:hypothetical protein|nr:cupin domain-containing protein [Paracoccaceae bacterium]